MATADELHAQALEQVQQRLVDEAIASLEAAIELDSRHIPAHELLAGLCFVRQDYERAIALFRRVSLLDPRNAKVLVNLGAAYNKQKNYPEAVKALRTALAKDSRSPEAYYNLGIAQRGAGQLALAISAYREAIRVKPDMVEAHCNLGNVFLEMKNYSQAIQQFRKAMEIRPDFVKAERGLRRAEDESRQAKQEISPFGRLVDMEEVERKNKQSSKRLDLTPQQRFEDRETVHTIAKAAELAATELLQQIKEELAAAVLGMSRLASEQSEVRAWAEELARLQIAFKRFRMKIDKVNEHTNALRGHEQEIEKFAH